jgi:phage shock protein PspC (stress-responsive transcriptional regulator)
MKQVIHINFQGRVVPIEVSASEMLDNYLQSLKRHFAGEPGCDEIVNDIESRIGELLDERLKKGAACITERDTTEIIGSIGQPHEFDGGQTNPDTGTSPTESTAKLVRNESDKILGGVCSGIAAYFNMEARVVRILFVLIALFFGGGVLAYIILWIALPRGTVAENSKLRKKLFRDPDNKIVAGVCSGAGNYLGINTWIPRTLFILPFLGSIAGWGNHFGNLLNLTFSPGALLAYIICWLVIPEARTTSEKLEMKGEPVDINSISKTVKSELKDVEKNLSAAGSRLAQSIGEKTQATGTASGRRRGLGDLIVLLLKIFGYFIISIVVFTLLAILFALAVSAVAVFPLRNYVIGEGWQNILSWGTLIFFIIVPLIALITWIIRRLTGQKRKSRLLATTFACLWTLGWFCAMALSASIGRDFKSHSTLQEQALALSNPAIEKLVVKNQESGNIILNNSPYKVFSSFNTYAADSFLLNNVHISIVKSPNDSFRVSRINFAMGRNNPDADLRATAIQYPVKQFDSLLVLPRGISIDRKNKFRNQQVTLVVYVPLGKQIRIERAENEDDALTINSGSDDIRIKNEEKNWRYNTDYVMKADGLYTMQGFPARLIGNESMNIEGTIDIRGGKDEEIHLNINGEDFEITTPPAPPAPPKAPAEKKTENSDTLIRIKSAISRLLKRNKTAEQNNLLENEPFIFISPFSAMP